MVVSNSNFENVNKYERFLTPTSTPTSASIATGVSQHKGRVWAIGNQIAGNLVRLINLIKTFLTPGQATQFVTNKFVMNKMLQNLSKIEKELKSTSDPIAVSTPVNVKEAEKTLAQMKTTLVFMREYSVSDENETNQLTTLEGMIAGAEQEVAVEADKNAARLARFNADFQPLNTTQLHRRTEFEVSGFNKKEVSNPRIDNSTNRLIAQSQLRKIIDFALAVPGFKEQVNHKWLGLVGKNHAETFKDILGINYAASKGASYNQKAASELAYAAHDVKKVIYSVASKVEKDPKLEQMKPAMAELKTQILTLNNLMKTVSQGNIYANQNNVAGELVDGGESLEPSIPKENFESVFNQVTNEGVKAPQTPKAVVEAAQDAWAVKPQPLLQAEAILTSNAQAPAVGA